MDEPMEAFEHAICSARPLPYYVVDRPALRVGREVLKHLNVEVTDAILANTGSSSSWKEKLFLWKKWPSLLARFIVFNESTTARQPHAMKA